MCVFYLFSSRESSQRGQTAIEYLIVLGVTTAIALVAFRTMLPNQRMEASTYFDKVANGVFGRPPNAPRIGPSGVCTSAMFNCYP